MESRFNHDFSKVRVHADARSAESARKLNALAYTVTPNIIFGSGKFAPQTKDGRRLLAHELAHVVQQDAGNAAARGPVPPAAAESLVQLKPVGPTGYDEVRMDVRTGNVPYRVGVHIERLVNEQPQFLIEHVLPKLMLYYADREIERELAPNVKAYEAEQRVYRFASGDSYLGNHCTDLVYNAAWLAGYELPTRKTLDPKKGGLMPSDTVFLNLERLEASGLVEIVVQPSTRMSGDYGEQLRNVRAGDVLVYGKEPEKPPPGYAWLGHHALIEEPHIGIPPKINPGDRYPMISEWVDERPGVPRPPYVTQGLLEGLTGEELQEYSEREQMLSRGPGFDVIEAGRLLRHGYRRLWPSDHPSAVYRFVQLNPERVIERYRTDGEYRQQFDDAWSAHASYSAVPFSE
jgi:hypothetical protein